LQLRIPLKINPSGRALLFTLAFFAGRCGAPGATRVVPIRALTIDKDRDIAEPEVSESEIIVNYLK
jgi:hypothetical protein